MLPAAQRLRRSTDFAAAIRGGRRAGRGTLVVHLLVEEPASASTACAGFVVPEAAGASVVVPEAAGTNVVVPEAARAGFVVSKAVGNAVVRNKVRRRLRHLVQPHLAELPAGTSVVVRALPPAAEASFATLAADLEGAIAAARRPRRPR